MPSAQNPILRDRCSVNCSLCTIMEGITGVEALSSRARYAAKGRHVKEDEMFPETAISANSVIKI